MSKRDQILGLDIGTAVVKAALAEPRGSHTTIARALTLRLPAGGAFDRAAIVGRWIREQGLAGSRCAIALPGQQAIFQPMFMVQGDPRSVEQAADMELVKMRDLAAEAMAHSLAPFPSPPGERRALLAMARPTVLDEATALVRQLELELVDIVPAPVALFNALAETAPAHDAPTIFAHVGHSVTEVAIGTPGGLAFARAFAGGGQLFTDALARARQMPAPHAETLKTSGACSLVAGDPADVKALTRAAEIWTAEFLSALTVYNNVFTLPRDRAARIVLSGGGALLGGFAEYVAGRAALPVALADRLPAQGAPEPRGVWAVAAGLAGGALHAPRCAISLVPHAIRDEWMFRRQKPFWIGAGATAALILAAGLAGGWYDSTRMQRHLRMQRASLERRRALVAEIEQARTRNEEMRQRVAPVVELLRAGPLRSRILALVAEAKAPRDWITLFCDADSYYGEPPRSGAPRRPGRESTDRRVAPEPVTVTEGVPPADDAARHIIVEGVTLQPSFATVQKLLDRLEASELVASADLLSDDKLANPALPADTPDGRGKRFAIDIKLRRP